jgi:hypothetical protein
MSTSKKKKATFDYYDINEAILKWHFVRAKIQEHVDGGQRLRHLQDFADLPKVVEPPKVAEFLIALLLSEAKGEAIIGDLSELFEKDCERYGATRARHMYRSRALRSLWPLLRRAASRAIKLAVSVEVMRKFFGF